MSNEGKLFNHCKYFRRWMFSHSREQIMPMSSLSYMAFQTGFHEKAVIFVNPGFISHTCYWTKMILLKHETVPLAQKLSVAFATIRVKSQVLLIGLQGPREICLDKIFLTLSPDTDPWVFLASSLLGFAVVP